jgi:hypothetical protein
MDIPNQFDTKMIDRGTPGNILTIEIFLWLLHDPDRNAPSKCPNKQVCVSVCVCVRA